MSRLIILFWSILIFKAGIIYSQPNSPHLNYEFYNHTFALQPDKSFFVPLPDTLNSRYIWSCYDQIDRGQYSNIVDSLIAYKEAHRMNDWLYYQLIRRTAQAISPKMENYTRYTFYKWFLMIKSGYDARLTIADGRIIFLVYNDEEIAGIPYMIYEGKKYMCLNYHDYAHADLNKIPPKTMIGIPSLIKPFSYKVNRMPDFKPEEYSNKKLEFRYDHKVYHFNIKVNPEIQQLFANYPGVDFEYYFNIPVSRETYGSLIPSLKHHLRRMSQKKGVDYLMRFTRYAFLYENDDENFGQEKRLSPEETLYSQYSDCDDRAALFFFLVKEIYNLPMIALLYPKHITMAVQFDKPIGEPIYYNGKIYSICEPTPQTENLDIGQVASDLKNIPFKVVYAYSPKTEGK